MTRHNLPLAPVALDEEDYQYIDALRDGGASWTQAGELVARVVARHADAMKAEGVRPDMEHLYRGIGARAGLTWRTVSQYVSTYNLVDTSDVTLCELQAHGYTSHAQARALLSLARKNGHSLRAEFDRWRATDNGMATPPDVLRAALAGDGKPATGTRLARALARLAAAAVAVDRALATDAGTGATRRDLWAKLYPQLVTRCEGEATK